ncbi:MAG: type II toxin-antitoxin system VapC family toxin, partial [Pseudonocardiaceae bacterium]
VEPRRLSARVARLIEDPANEIFLSAISVYEIVVKMRLGRLKLPEPSATYVRAERERRGILPLPLDEDAALAAERLPEIHKDPFDRLLIAQSIAAGLTLLTPDATIARYPILVEW